MSENRRAVFGRFYTSSEPAAVAVMDIGTQRQTHQTGFRLAFDSAEQRDWGGCWNYDICAGSRSFGGNASPEARVKTLGFRLAREGT